MQNAKFKEKEAKNWVVEEYAKVRDNAMKEMSRSRKRVRLPPKTREDLIAQAIGKFGLSKDFDVPKQTISDRVRKKRHTVWQPGEISPVIQVEVLLIPLIICAWALNRPLGVKNTIRLMNSLLKGTETAFKLIKWKEKRQMYNPKANLVDEAWWRGFERRNPELETKAGRKFPRNRADHCTDSAFRKMCDQNKVLSWTSKES